MKNRKPARKYLGLSERKQGECLESLEHIMYRYVEGTTKAQVLLKLKQLERIAALMIKTERAEIIAEFSADDDDESKLTAGALLAMGRIFTVRK